MIDIHCHLLYGVDDGAKTIEESVAMLEAAKEQGISAMILTPHYRHGMFAYPKEEIEEHFRILEPYAQKLGIYLALGTEYHVNSHIVEALDSGRCRTMAAYPLWRAGRSRRRRLLYRSFRLLSTANLHFLKKGTFPPPCCVQSCGSVQVCRG